MAGVEEEMEVVLVADIGGEHGAVEVGGALIAVIAASVGIVKVETYIQTLAGINGKGGVDMVFTVGLIAAGVILHAGIRREGVHKAEPLRALLHEAVGLCEDERLALRTVDEDAAQAGCIVVTRIVELAIDTVVEDGVHKQV